MPPCVRLNTLLSAAADLLPFAGFCRQPRAKALGFARGAWSFGGDFGFGCRRFALICLILNSRFRNRVRFVQRLFGFPDCLRLRVLPHVVKAFEVHPGRWKIRCCSASSRWNLPIAFLSPPSRSARQNGSLWFAVPFGFCGAANDRGLLVGAP